VYYRKTKRPTSEHLAMLEGLVDGENVLTFSVKTRRGGISTLTCMLYLWEPECKIVISDVDGTITRSDVMGQVSVIFFLSFQQ
jgi:phosphatidate phosphatase LPIN